MIYKNIKELLTLEGVHRKDGRHLLPEDLSIKKMVTLVEKDGFIQWIGNYKDLPSEFKKEKEIDCSDLVITPGLVDSHTHLVFGGNRAFEYSMRLNGASYEEIASAGGGILNSMENTKKTSREKLLEEARVRLDRLISYGISAVEIKSGYALEYEKEKEISEIIHTLKNEYRGKIDIFNTYLAAHAVPKSFKSSHEYLKQVVIPLMQELHKNKMIDAVDIFHEKDYFDEKDTRTLFDEAKKISLAIKIHADEFNDNNGASIACEYEALSCDHLLQTSEKGIKALSQVATVATLLPGTAFFLGKPLAAARKFLDAGCKVALATDYNPGSCHCDNLILIAQIAGKNLNMNIAELWAAITYNASAALGLTKQGVLKEGMKAKLSFFKANSFDEIFYQWGRNLCATPQEYLQPTQETLRS